MARATVPASSEPTTTESNAVAGMCSKSPQPDDPDEPLSCGFYLCLCGSKYRNPSAGPFRLLPHARVSLPRASTFISLPQIPSATVVSLSLQGLLPQVRAGVLTRLFVWVSSTALKSSMRSVGTTLEPAILPENGLWDSCGMTYFKTELPRDLPRSD